MSLLIAALGFLLVGGLLVGVAFAADVIPFWLAVVAVVFLGISFALTASRGKFVRRRQTASHDM